MLSIFRPAFVTGTLNTAIGLVKHLFSKLTRNMTFQVDILNLSVTILLYSLHLYENKMNSDDVIIDTLKKYQSALQEWVNNADVIGGSFFGGRIVSKTLLRCDDEFKVHYRLNVHR